MFYKEVDLTNREDMLSFLGNHFRYHTMNSWNCQESFANNVKINNLELGEYCSRAYDIIFQGDFQEFVMRDAFDSFNDLCGDGYEVGSNGRSGGYIVLYAKSEWAKSGLYRQDFDNDDELLIFTVKAVQALDCLCDNLVEELIEYCKTYKVEERTIMVPKKVNVLVEISSEDL